MIRFTQFMRPNGRKELVEIDRPKEIEAMANTLIEGGAVFEIEHLTTGAIHMDCSIPDFNPHDPDVANPLSLELCKNGPPVLDAVDKLISDSFQLWKKLTKSEGGG